MKNGDSGVPLVERILSLALFDVRANPHQPRRNFDDASLHELASSLRTNGVIQPIIVRQVGEGFELIAGERRLRAAKLAGLSVIPAIVKEVDGLTQAQLALVENIQRENLNPVDRALAYRVLLEQLGLSHAELAQRLGEERSTISNHLRLLDLAAPVQELMRTGQLALGHAKVIAGVADVLEQERLGNQVVAEQLSVRALETRIQEQAAAQPAKPATGKPGGVTPHIPEPGKKSIARQLGLQAQVRSKQNGSGKLVLHYKSLDQFDDLMGKLGVKTSEED